MSITNKEDIVELYVLLFYNLDIYLNKDDEEGDNLEEWQKSHEAQKSATKWMTPMMTEEDLIYYFQNQGGCVETNKGKEVD